MSGRGRVRQLVDWGAVIKAGFLAGLVFLLVNLFLTQVFVPDMKPKRMCQYFGSVLLGEAAFEEPAKAPEGFRVSPPDDVAKFILAPTPKEWRLYAAMLLTHFAAALLAAGLIAFIVHEGGLARGCILGAIIGGCLYVINMYAMTKFAPSLFSLHHWFFVATHVLFGALCGALYEAFEVEIFVDHHGKVVAEESPSPS